MHRMQFQAPPLTKVNKILIVAIVAGFILSSVGQLANLFNLPYIFGLSASGLTRGLIFQLLTYPLVDTSLLAVIFSCLIIWFMGADLEYRWGIKAYQQFLFFCVLGAGFVYAVIGFLASPQSLVATIPLIGSQGITFSLLFAFGYLFPERQLFFLMLFPMKARYFCLILGAIQLYLAIFSSHAHSAWAHIAAMACAVVFIKWRAGELSRLNWSNYLKNRRKESMKKKLYVVKDEDDEHKPRYWQ